MTSVPVQNNSLSSAEGIRQVNLRTDLAPLADLIELVFADSMNQGGRAAVREMRYLSQISAGISLFPGLNDLTHGINMGYVWIADGRLVGNVSIYPARSLIENTWVVVNVGVHPDYRRRGIATQLMQTSMEAIRARGGRHAVLQVEAENHSARRMYERLGFIEERAWTIWRRSGSMRMPPPIREQNAYIAHRRPGEWQAELALAKRLRPADQGGLGWLRPLHPQEFRKTMLKHVTDWFNMRSTEHLVIRSDDERQLLAAMWIERGFLASSVNLTLLIDPAYRGTYDEVLLNTATRRFAGRGTALVVEHPTDETRTSEILRDYAFRPQREMIHMRWDV